MWDLHIPLSQARRKVTYMHRAAKLTEGKIDGLAYEGIESSASDPFQMKPRKILRRKDEDKWPK